MGIRGIPGERIRPVRMASGEIVLRLPEWMRGMWSDLDVPLDTVEERMRFVIGLARKNLDHKTGGPFGAAVFEIESGRILGAGVNLVEASHCSIAHAEMMAIGLAQQATGRYDLGGHGMPAAELVTSTEPCAMCLGAIPWSGVRRVICGARGEDACAIGFDEGAKPVDWTEALRQRGIDVVLDVRREEARAVLQQYERMGGAIYNAGQGR